MTTAEPSTPGVEGADLPATRRVELSLPAEPELLFLARMTAAAVASRADFGIDQVEDLRLAIDELCITLTGEDVHTEGRVHLVFEWQVDTLEVVGKLVAEHDRLAAVPRPGASQPEVNVTELSGRILDALVDEHGTDNVGGTPRAWFRVRRHPRQP
jgi:hypothetical protein